MYDNEPLHKPHELRVYICVFACVYVTVYMHVPERDTL